MSMLGAASVNSNLKSLNQKFFNKNPNSTNNNAKAMAYLLDKDIWTTKFIGNASGNDKVEYVVGGPTIEQIVGVNNKKHKDKSLYLQSTDTGYQISNDNSIWNEYLANALNTNDSELVITTNDRTDWMWIASPSNYENDGVVRVSYNVEVGSGNCIESSLGFRPMVCLKSGVQLKTTDRGYAIQ